MTVVQRLRAKAVSFMAFAVNFYLSRYIPKQKRQSFFDIDAINPALRVFERSLSTVQKELDAALQQGSLPDYHDLDPRELSISAPENNSHWRVFMLYAYGRWPTAARRLCPELCRMLENIPDLVAAFFSVLDGGKSIPPHSGPFLTHLCYHLGVRVPTENKPFMRVLEEKVTWEVGEAFIFDDSLTHEVVNVATQRRVVLIIDFLRPLPGVPMFLTRLINKVIVPHTYGRKFAKKLG